MHRKYRDICAGEERSRIIQPELIILKKVKQLEREEEREEEGSGAQNIEGEEGRILRQTRLGKGGRCGAGGRDKRCWEEEEADIYRVVDGSSLKGFREPK